MSSCSHTHPDHSDQMHALKRARGQLEGVMRMIEEKKYCPDILVQLRAVRSAVKSIEANILETHLGACVKAAVETSDESEIDKKLAEIARLFKRFEN